MSTAQTPLFEPVLWEGEGFRILDETQVPEKIHYIDVHRLDEAIAAVREMKTRAFGQVLTFLYSGALIAQRHGASDGARLKRKLADMTEQFCAARPTFDFRGLGSFFEVWCDALPRGGNSGESIARAARRCAQEIVRGRELRARRAAELLPDPAAVLTHCNISGELVVIARFCRELGKPLRVLASETRPYLQGTRLTAWELSQANVPVTAVADGAIANIMARGDVNAVIVGADRVARNGDVINKVGTYPLARLANEYGVSFYALVQDPRSLRRGTDVTIEERPAAELLSFHGRALLPEGKKGLNVRYPAFDVTPAHLINRLIGFDGVYSPEGFRKKYDGDPSMAREISSGKAKYLLVHGVPRKGDYTFLTDSLRRDGAQSILIPEMRPQLCGARIVARELLDRGVPTTLICDNMMGTLFAQGEIRRALLFFRTLADRGGIGICGALLAAQLARLHNVPVQAFQGAGELEQIPEILDHDVSTFLGIRTCPSRVEIETPEDELVPWNILNAS